MLTLKFPVKVMQNRQILLDFLNSLLKTRGCQSVNRNFSVYIKAHVGVSRGNKNFEYPKMLNYWVSDQSQNTVLYKRLKIFDCEVYYHLCTYFQLEDCLQKLTNFIGLEIRKFLQRLGYFLFLNRQLKFNKTFSTKDEQYLFVCV
eukprot:TRINITY_DN61344_c0_g1_i1.p1 TRINITY_DN61344_c0_g1~~TRINITY_DN61344_c0_g1_i1.p1  ORF type:complete len:145 (+),score=3.22 TRINITY_DN61344_c0_g1_i1:86-520(+)